MRKKYAHQEFKAGTTVPAGKFLPYGLLLQKLIEDCFRSEDTHSCESCLIKKLGYDDVCRTLKRERERQTIK